MDFNFPSINTTILNELTTLYDELIEIKKRESEFKFHLQKKQEDFQLNINKILQDKDNKIKLLETELNDQKKKLELIHNLFNMYKDNNDMKLSEDKIVDIIFNSSKMGKFDNRIVEIKTLYDRYLNIKTTSSNILEKSYEKLFTLNKNLLESQKNLEDNNTKFMKRITSLEQIVNKQNELIKNLQQNNGSNTKDLTKNPISKKFQPVEKGWTTVVRGNKKSKNRF